MKHKPTHNVAASMHARSSKKRTEELTSAERAPGMEQTRKADTDAAKTFIVDVWTVLVSMFTLVETPNYARSRFWQPDESDLQ